MKKRLFLLLIPLVALIAAGAVAADSGQGDSGRVYVKSESQALRSMLGKNHDFGQYFSTKNSAGVKAMAVLGLIEVEPVQKVKALGYKFVQSGYDAAADCLMTADPTPWGIDMVAGGSGGAGIIVAVLDTGVDTDHPDLVLDENDFCVGMGAYATCEDGNGHGTHVAGTILAKGRILGVAPEARLMAIKVLGDDGSGSGDVVASGIRYAADNGAQIISMSLGADRSDYGMAEAVKYAAGKGVLVVAAAGNDGPKTGTIDYPGAYPEVIAAGAVDINEAVARFSSRGITDGDDATIVAKELELAAPGVNVLSAYIGGSYACADGTSMATPHVSGLAAMLWQANGSAATRSHLRSIAKDIYTAGYDIATGYGLPIAGYTAPEPPACQPVEEICGDGIDNDCDGETDEGCEPALECGVCFKGVCDGVCHPKKDGLSCPDCQI